MSKTISSNGSAVTLTAAYNPLTIASGVTVGGSGAGVYGDNAVIATLTNYGTIGSSADAGVNLLGGGTLANDGVSSSISGSSTGILLGAASTIVNDGTVVGGKLDGILLGGGGSVTNSAVAAHVMGARYGLYALGGDATITNFGLIAGVTADGVHITAGGMVTNTGTMATISGGRNGVAAYGADAVISNQGTIFGAKFDGVLLATNGAVSNLGAASAITGGNFGVRVTGATSTVSNLGLISGAQFGGLLLEAGGMVVNAGKDGTITGGQFGILVDGGAAGIVNKGLVSGTHNYGILLQAGGTITNSKARSQIMGGQFGVAAYAVPITISNAGTIAGAQYDGVNLAAGGAVTNTTRGSDIYGTQYGVFASEQAAIVTNHGTIGGGVGAVHFADVSGNVLRVFPQAVTSGDVHGGAGNDTLILAAAKATGRLSGIGSQFTGFETVSVASGGRWIIEGGNTLENKATLRLADNAQMVVTGGLTAPGNVKVLGAGTLSARAGGRIEIGPQGLAAANQIVVDSGQSLVAGGVLSAANIRAIGTITASGQLTLDASVSGSGTIAIGHDSALNVVGRLGVSHLVFLPGGNEVLGLGRASAAGIAGFVATDTIDLLNVGSLTARNFTNGTLDVVGSSASIDLRFVGGGFVGDPFQITDDGHGGLFVNLK